MKCYYYIGIFQVQFGQLVTGFADIFQRWYSFHLETCALDELVQLAAIQNRTSLVRFPDCEKVWRKRLSWEGDCSITPAFMNLWTA